MLRYTGHPFVDVGVAAITAFVGKGKPQEITYKDLDQVAGYLKNAYVNLKGVQGQLTTLFPNSGFTQAAFKQEQKSGYGDQVLYGFLPEATKLNVTCVFYPEKPAYIYAHRQFIPLLSADGTINFSPEGGRQGIPISGEALLAIAAILLGAFRCKNWLIFHEISPSSDVDMMLVLARDAVKAVRATINLLSLQPDNKWPTLKKPRQVYIDKILDAQTQIGRREVKPGNITGYHFSNYGPNPSIEVVRLENDVWGFISTARNDAEHAWNKFLAVGQVDKDYNQSYDALFDLPHNYRRFFALLKLVADWNFTEIFLRKVMKMNQRRIQLLKDLGERFVKHMDQHERDGKGGIKLGFYHQFSRADSFGDFRKVLLKASDDAFKKGNQTLLTMEEFVLAFNSPEDRYESWTLARDLVALRMLELLPDLGISAEDRSPELEAELANSDQDTTETE